MPGIKNPTLVIKSYDNYETDVLPALLDDDGQLLKKVEALEKFTVDTSAQKCTEALKDAAAVLEIVIAASHGLPCNAKIINLLGRYQTLVVDADIATAAFLTACMQALKYFKTAFACLEKNRIDLAEKMLLATSKIAGGMEAIATKIATASGEAAEEALTILNTTDVATSAAQASKNETDAAVKASKGTTSILEKDLEEKTRRVSAAQAAEKTAMSQRNMQGQVDTTDYSVLWGLWEVSRQGERDKMSHLEAVENAKRAACVEALKKQQETNQEITKIALELANLHITGETHGRAVTALEMTTKALGKIKTSFHNVQVFWSMLKGRCNSRATDNEQRDTVIMLAGDGDTDLLVESMTDEWYQWLALAKINYAAVIGMGDVKKSVHHIMSNLPTSEEAEARFPGLLKELQAILKTEAEHIGQQLITQEAAVQTA